jgi:hypothetical protein
MGSGQRSGAAKAGRHVTTTGSHMRTGDRGEGQPGSGWKACWDRRGGNPIGAANGGRAHGIEHGGRLGKQIP